MSNFKLDARNAGFLIIALMGGIVGGVVSDYLTEDSELMTQAAFRSELLTKDTQIATLTNKILALENDYVQLSESLETLESLSEVGFTTPDYDSYWMTIDQGDSVEVNHNLGSTNLLVYLIGEYDDNYTHQYAYGGNEERYIEYEIIPGEMYYNAVERYGTLGAWWRTDGQDKIIVSRPGHDDYWHEFRVLIWRLPE
ncbi:MAG TPA: hypothetical protein VGB32_07050 [Candidatus Bathyarchaeia archaeon]